MFSIQLINGLMQKHCVVCALVQCCKVLTSAMLDAAMQIHSYVVPKAFCILKDHKQQDVCA